VVQKAPPPLSPEEAEQDVIGDGGGDGTRRLVGRDLTRETIIIQGDDMSLGREEEASYRAPSPPVPEGSMQCSQENPIPPTSLSPPSSLRLVDPEEGEESQSEVILPPGMEGVHSARNTSMMEDEEEEENEGRLPFDDDIGLVSINSATEFERHLNN